MPGVATKFWIVCGEETPLTRRLVKEVNEWRVPGVRARLSYRMPLSAESAIAKAEHAIFITLSDYPYRQVRVDPVGSHLPNTVCSSTAFLPTSFPPTSFLHALRCRHGKAPNAWWFQVPTTEVCQQGTKHVSLEHSLSQTLSKIELFVRNYNYSHVTHTDVSGRTPSSKLSA